MAKGMHATTGTRLETSYPENNLTGLYPKLPRAMYAFSPKLFLWPIKAMPHGSDFYNEFAKIPQIHEKSYRAMEFSTKSL